MTSRKLEVIIASWGDRSCPLPVVCMQVRLFSAVLVVVEMVWTRPRTRPTISLLLLLLLAKHPHEADGEKHTYFSFITTK